MKVKEAREKMSQQKQSERPKLADLNLGNAASLQRKKFEPVRWIAPRYVPEGLSLLVGKPKVGKSWMALDLCIAVSTGGKFLGGECQQGDVLGLFLEDPERRLQSRITTMIGAQKEKWPERFQYATMQNDWPRLGEGGLDMMREWIGKTPEARLLVVDILERVRDRGQRRNQTQYEEDYEALKPLHKLASDTRVSIMVLHHQRKAQAENPIDKISGTGGLGGAVDTLLLLEKDNATTKLHGTGREFGDFNEIVRLGENCRWVSVGEGHDVRSAERAQIVAVLAQAGKPMHVSEISEKTGRKQKSVTDLLAKMCGDHEVDRVSTGVYRLPQVQSSMDLGGETHI